MYSFIAERDKFRDVHFGLVNTSEMQKYICLLVEKYINKSEIYIHTNNFLNLHSHKNYFISLQIITETFEME